MTLEFKTVEIEGKTHINIKNTFKTTMLDTLEMWSIVVLLSSLVIGYLSNYTTIFVILTICVIIVIIEFISIFYIITHRKTLNVVIDPVNRSFTTNNKFTFVFENETKIIQYYKNIQGEKYYSNLVFEINGEKKIGSLGDGDANYYFANKLHEILEIPFSSEVTQERTRTGKSDKFIIIQSIFLLSLSVVFLYSFLLG